MNKDILFETFKYDIPGNGSILWNITLAKHLIKSRSVATVKLEEEDMREIVSRNEYDLSHTHEVDPFEPGIAAPIVWEGEIIYVLIDGIHRCARALQDGVSFRARLLCDEDARTCWLNGKVELMV